MIRSMNKRRDAGVHVMATCHGSNVQMFYVYVLRLSNNQLYTGYTNDLKRRVKEHQAGKSNFTSKYLPVQLIHYECYLDQSDALRREKYLKSTEGKKMFRKQIKNLYDSFND